jgi:hypothetical protein
MMIDLQKLLKDDGHGGKIRVDLTELIELVNEEFRGAYQQAGHYILLMHIYTVWKELPDV